MNRPQTPANCKHDWKTVQAKPFPVFQCQRCGEMKEFPQIQVKKAP